jgi:hypothetical protein
MAFIQLSYRESLRDIEACLRSAHGKLYHLGGVPQPRGELDSVRQSRDWRIYADFAQVLIGIARPLYAHDPLSVDLDQSVYALDSTTIEVCLSLFPWAGSRQHKATVHRLLDWCGSVSTFIPITEGKVHDVDIMALASPPPCWQAVRRTTTAYGFTVTRFVEAGHLGYLILTPGATPQSKPTP